MEQYVTKRDVALLDEHEITDEEGAVFFNLTEEALQKIADHNNQLIQDTGDEIPIVIGHTTDTGPEGSQPQIVGWAKDLKVHRLYNTGRKAIFATCRFLKDKVELAKKFPRRSVELWLNKMLIDPISLLGATTPERHLGLLKFSAGGHTYTTESPEEPMEHEELVAAVLDALEKTDVWQFMRQKMEEESGGQEASPEEPGMDGPPPGDDGAPPEPEGEGEGDTPMPMEEPPEEPVRESAMASGSNCFTPGMDKARMSADQLRGQLFRFQAKEQEREKEVKKLRLKLSMVEREKDLIQLENEGYDFDRAEELEYVASLSKERYTQHLALIRKRYRAAPVNRVRHSAGRNPGPTPNKRPQTQAQEAISLATSKGISYAAALQELEGNATKVY